MVLPHHEPELTLNLERCSWELIERVCLPIERPGAVSGVPEDDSYETLEQFYKAVERGLKRLSVRRPLFESPRLERQVLNPAYYAVIEYDSADSGGILPIDDLESAERAIETVIHQGEGLRDEHYADPEHHEMTHYYKFKQLAEGTVPLGETRPVPTNPKTADLPNSLQSVSDLFNACYCYLFLILEALYSPLDTEKKDRLVDELYVLMMGILRPLARYLTRQPLSDDGARTAGPTFEFYRFARKSEPTAELFDLARDAVNQHPELERLGDVVEQFGGIPS